jgi:hypothetical protein
MGAAMAVILILLLTLALREFEYIGNSCPPVQRGITAMPDAAKYLSTVHRLAHLQRADPVKYGQDSKVLMLRHFFDSKEERESLVFFLNHGIKETNFKSHNVELVIICSGSRFPYHEVSLPEGVKVVERQNTGLDFGGYIEVLENMQWGEGYDFIVILNGTIVGPLLPLKRMGEDWLAYFIEMLDSHTRMSGMSINIFERWGELHPHIQSMLLVMEGKTLRDLHDWGIMIPVPSDMDKETLVWHYEVGVSKALIQRGYNIACLLPIYDQIDFSKLMQSKEAAIALQKINPNVPIKGDVWYNNGYFGGPVSPSDTIFVKSNRFNWGAVDILLAQREIFGTINITSNRKSVT